MPDGGMTSAMEYDMEDLLVACVDKYKELAKVKDVRPYPTPCITEDHTNSPSGKAGEGPCVECPWCKHTFPPNACECVSALEADIQRRKKDEKAAKDALEASASKCPDGKAGAAPNGGNLGGSEGRLALIASRIRMKMCCAARLARFDLLRTV